MSLRSTCGMALALACLAFAGCVPTGETSADEQRNPHYQAGRERLRASDYQGAIDSFERALQDNPKSCLAHFELGVIYDQHKNDYAAALYHYNKALEIRPTGYPSDHIRQRIPGCKQELIKADSLAVLNPTALRETDRLREENQALRKQIDTLQAYIAAHSLPGPVLSSGVSAPTTELAAGAGPLGAGPASPAGFAGRPVPALGGTSTTDGARIALTSSPKGRQHTVKAGETLAAIARQYQIKLPALLAANPGLDPRRLRVGQMLNVPAS